jgi:hypothetical protein
MNTSVKKIVGISALGAISLVEMMYLQEASATPANFTGTTQSNPRGGSVQVVITVDGASGNCQSLRFLSMIYHLPNTI